MSADDETPSTSQTLNSNEQANGSADVAEETLPDDEDSDGEGQPLIRAMPSQTTKKLCSFTVISLLVAAWCILDTWNSQVSDALTSIGIVKNVAPSIDSDGQDQYMVQDIIPFSFPLTLAMIQFGFMGFVFIVLWLVLSKDVPQDYKRFGASFYHLQWPLLIVTHIFSNFWLQALMIPNQTMSLGVFALTRAAEIPIVFMLRWYAFGSDVDARRLFRYALLFCAAWLLCYSYTQLAGCMSMWSGHGVMLSGLLFFIIYGLVRIIPAANVVCQEVVMVQLDINPLLMLAVMNLLSFGIFIPILLFSEMAGLEDPHQAVVIMMESAQVDALTLWLCVQHATLSAVTVALILTVNSFWTVAMRCMRVVYWWCHQTFMFCFFGSGLLSVEAPRASLWSFIMMCACGLAMATWALDPPSDDLITTQTRTQKAEAPVEGETKEV